MVRGDASILPAASSSHRSHESNNWNGPDGGTMHWPYLLFFIFFFFFFFFFFCFSADVVALTVFQIDMVMERYQELVRSDRTLLVPILGSLGEMQLTSEQKVSAC
jgi:cadmium resistance protein CadD (predicted permease)